MIDRYEISCRYCGVLSYAPTLLKALRAAEAANPKHSMDYEHVTVFDRMAHHGQPELFDAHGKILQRRILGVISHENIRSS